MRALSIICVIPVLALSACATPGEENRADSYTADQVNARQEAKVVNILAILPAKVQVSNAQNQRAAQIGGAGVGVGAGSLVPGKVMVQGVSLTYVEDGHTFNSAQVGKLCEFKLGQAIMVQTAPNVTRIQPNTACPTGKTAG